MEDLWTIEIDNTNKTKINKSRKRIGNIGGKLKDRSKANGIGKNTVSKKGS